jgi:proteic killer suppression protein
LSLDVVGQTGDCELSAQGTERLFEDGETKGIRADLLEKVENILAVLNRAACPNDMDLPGFRLHPLKGGSERVLRSHGSGKLAGDLPI